MSLQSKRFTYLRDTARYNGAKFASVNSTESARFHRGKYFAQPQSYDSEVILAVGSVAHSRAPLRDRLTFAQKQDSSSTLRQHQAQEFQKPLLNNITQASAFGVTSGTIMQHSTERFTHRLHKKRLPQSGNWGGQSSIPTTRDSPLIPTHTLYRRKEQNETPFKKDTGRPPLTPPSKFKSHSQSSPTEKKANLSPLRGAINPIFPSTPKRTKVRQETGQIGLSIETPSHLKKQAKDENLLPSSSIAQSPTSNKEKEIEMNQDQVTAILRKKAMQDHTLNGIDGGIFTQEELVTLLRRMRVDEDRIHNLTIKGMQSPVPDKQKQFRTPMVSASVSPSVQGPSISRNADTHSRQSKYRKEMESLINVTPCGLRIEGDFRLEKERKLIQKENFLKDLRRVLRALQVKAKRARQNPELRQDLRKSIQNLLQQAKNKEEMQAVIGALPKLLSLSDNKRDAQKTRQKYRYYSEKKVSEFRDYNTSRSQAKDPFIHPHLVAPAPALMPSAPPRLYPIKRPGQSNPNAKVSVNIDQLATCNQVSQAFRANKTHNNFTKTTVAQNQAYQTKYGASLAQTISNTARGMADSSPFTPYLEHQQFMSEQWKPQMDMISITGTTLGGSSIHKIEFPKRFVPVLQEHQNERKTTSPSKRVPGHFVKSMGSASPGKKEKKQKDPAQTALRQLAQHTVCVSGSSPLVKLDYRKAKINILHPDYKLHYKHEINHFFRLMNVFIFATFRFKGTNMNMPLIYKVARSLGLINMLPRFQLDEKKFKQKDFALALKQRILHIMHKKLNHLYGIKKQPTPCRFQLKFFIGRGNNHFLIRSVMKSRWWWSASDRQGYEDAHFMWTTWKDKRFMSWLPTHQKVLQEEKKKQLQLLQEKLTAKEKKMKKKESEGKEEEEIEEDNKDQEDEPTSETRLSLKQDQTEEKSISKQISNAPTRASTITSLKKAGVEYPPNHYKIEPLAEEDSVESQNSDSDGQSRFQNEYVPYRVPHMRICNKLEDNYHLGHKIALFLNMRAYYTMMGQDVFDTVPVTYSLDQGGLSDPEFLKFKEHYNKIEKEKSRLMALKKKQDLDRLRNRHLSSSMCSGLNSDDDQDRRKLSNSPKRKKKKVVYRDESEEEEDQGTAQFAYEGGKKTYIPKNIWIIKPGELSNCGRNIMVAQDFNQIKNCILDSYENSYAERPTVIVQKYIQRPLLVYNRKFDMRVYAMLTSINGRMKGYFYEDGYVRTSSFFYTLKNFDNKYIHLTNDAIQKHGEEYGRFETGNKLSYNEMQRYFEQHFPHVHFFRDIAPQIKKLITDSFRAVWRKIDPSRKHNGFEIYGYDFMIDQNFKVILIECNTNPDLSFAAPLVARIVSNLIDNAFRIVIDPLFPPPDINRKAIIAQDPVTENRFTLIFDDKIDGPILESYMNGTRGQDIEINVDDSEEEKELREKESAKEEDEEEAKRVKEITQKATEEQIEEDANIEGIDIDAKEEEEDDEQDQGKGNAQVVEEVRSFQNDGK